MGGWSRETKICRSEAMKRKHELMLCESVFMFKVVKCLSLRHKSLGLRLRPGQFPLLPRCGASLQVKH